MRSAVLITGAAGGIGAALCSAFKDSGYHVVATDKQFVRNVDGFVRAELRELIDDAALRDKFCDEVRYSFEGMKLVGLINNAATQILGSLQELDVKAFQDSIAVNLTAPFVLTKMFLSDLVAAKGAVVNIGSVHAQLTKPGFVAYGVSKSGLLGLTRALAVDLGPSGVRVNIVQPAATRTNMLIDGFEKQPEALAQLESCHPLGRIAATSEIADVAVFLVSQHSRFITGASINIDGGISVRLHDPL